MNRRNGNRNANQIMLEYIDAKQDRFDAKLDTRIGRSEDKFTEEMRLLREDWKSTLKAMEDRIAADRKEAEARQQATEARLVIERKESEARLERERLELMREFRQQKFLMAAN